MERVQYQLERSLGELQQLDEEGTFSKAELRSVVRKRTAFETALVRRIADERDFLRYAEFEIELDKLRRKRIERMKLSPAATTKANGVAQARIRSIFERAVRKFKGDVALWLAYIEWARSKGMRVVTGRVFARALQLHPSSIQVWIHAASYELEFNHSPDAARRLLQRGIRLNRVPFDPSSTLPVTASEVLPANLGGLVHLWTEYAKMEMIFAERLRRRWQVLGVEGSEEVNEIVKTIFKMGLKELPPVAHYSFHLSLLRVVFDFPTSSSTTKTDLVSVIYDSLASEFGESSAAQAVSLDGPVAGRSRSPEAL